MWFLLISWLKDIPFIIHPFSSSVNSRSKFALMISPSKDLRRLVRFSKIFVFFHSRTHSALDKVTLPTYYRPVQHTTKPIRRDASAQSPTNFFLYFILCLNFFLIFYTTPMRTGWMGGIRRGRVCWRTLKSAPICYVTPILTFDDELSIFLRFTSETKIQVNF